MTTSNSNTGTFGSSNIPLTAEQIKIIKRMRGGESLSASKTSGQFWMDSYDMVKNAAAKGLIATGMIAEDTGTVDNYSTFYKLTERGLTTKI